MNWFIFTKYITAFYISHLFRILNVVWVQCITIILTFAFRPRLSPAFPRLSLHLFFRLIWSFYYIYVNLVHLFLLSRAPNTSFPHFIIHLSYRILLSSHFCTFFIAFSYLKFCSHIIFHLCDSFTYVTPMNFFHFSIPTSPRGSLPSSLTPIFISPFSLPSFQSFISLSTILPLYFSNVHSTASLKEAWGSKSTKARERE